MDLSLGVLCTECRSLSGSCHWLCFTSHSLSLGAKLQPCPALPKLVSLPCPRSRCGARPRHSVALAEPCRAELQSCERHLWSPCGTAALTILRGLTLSPARSCWHRNEKAILIGKDINRKCGRELKASLFSLHNFSSSFPSFCCSSPLLHAEQNLVSLV